MRNDLINRQPLTDEALRRLAPAAFAEAPAGDVSDKYAFIPTSRVIAALRGEGWTPVMAREQRVLNEDRVMVAKHSIHFQHGEIKQLDKVGDVVPELILTNAHDRTSAYNAVLGIWRLACGNGMVVRDTNIMEARIRHVGYTDDAVRNASELIIEAAPQVVQRVEAYRNTILDEQEQMAFAVSAALAKWKVDLPEQLPFDPRKLVDTVRRHADEGPDLWHVMNRVQENLVRGGIKYLGKRTSIMRPPRRTSRPITGLSEDLRVNRAVWTLAENMRRIKCGEPLM